MRARLWLNLGLLAVVLVLAALAWFQPGTGEAPKPALTDLDPQSVAGITVSDADGERAALERNDGNWRLTRPRELPAGASRVQPLVDVLTADVESELGDIGDDPGQYGLGEPDLTVDYGKRRIAFGDRHPVKAQRYVAVDGRLALIADRHYRGADKSWTELVSQRLLPEGAEITAIELAERTVERSDEGGYRVKPAEPAVAEDAADELVRAWRNTRAMSVSEHSGDGGNDDATRVVVRLADRDEPIVFRARTREGRLVVARPDAGISYELPSSKRSRLLELAAPEDQDDSEETASPDESAGQAAGSDS